MAGGGDGGAAKVMVGLADAATQRKGFTGSAGGGKQHVGVGEYDSFLTAQNSVGLRLTTKVGKQTLPVYLDVGSVGSTVECYATFGAGAS